MGFKLLGNIQGDIHTNLIRYANTCVQNTYYTYSIREKLREMDLAYQREVDLSIDQQRAKQANRSGDPNKFQNVVIPVVMPQVETATAYQTAVFLTPTPLFEVNASPQYEDQAKQMETVIEQQAIKGSWKRHMQLFFRDGFKYNLCALEVTWDTQVTFAVDTDVNFGKGKQGKPKQVLWEGNTVRRMDMYNTFFDSRVAPADISKRGEYAGYTEYLSKIALKDFIAKIPVEDQMNIRDAFESGNGIITTNNETSGYYIPDINPNAIIDKANNRDFNWMAWAGLEREGRNIKYSSGYLLRTLYARILPSEFGFKVPQDNTPQIWKFYIINDKVVIYAERQTNAHNLIPILFCQPNEDGLNYQTKSLADNALPIQSIATALSNSNIAARRRAVSDRVLFDPSRIDAKHINSEAPAAKIPVKPSAYGKSISESVYAFPYRDDQSQSVMQQMALYMNLANNISGQNPARQGQFVKGNKTQSEFDDIMSNASSRDQMCSILIEAQVMVPLKEILKINILQYQGGTTLYNPTKKQNVAIDPVQLRKSILEFKASDGLTPASKVMHSDTMQVALQTISSSPQLGAGFNIAPLVSYLLKTQGADISPFEKSPAQVAYEQAVGQWQQIIQQLTEQAIKAGQDISKIQWPPQPVPATYGYDPQAPLGAGSQQGNTLGVAKEQEAGELGGGNVEEAAEG